MQIHIVYMQRALEVSLKKEKNSRQSSRLWATFRDCKRWSTRCEAGQMGRKSLLRGSQDVQDHSRTAERVRNEKTEACCMDWNSKMKPIFHLADFVLIWNRKGQEPPFEHESARSCYVAGILPQYQKTLTESYTQFRKRFSRHSKEFLPLSSLTQSTITTPGPMLLCTQRSKGSDTEID